MPDVRPAHRPSVELPTASPFSRLALTHAVSTAAEAFMTVALAGTLFFTVSPDSARPRVMLFLALTMAPFAVVSPVLGPLMDRSRSGRRLFVVATCAGRAALALLMARHRNTLFLFPEAFGVLVLSKGYAVARASIVPSVVDDDDSLVTANSRLALIAVLGGFVGGLPAAGLLQLSGAATVLVVAAFVYAAAAVAALRLPRAAVKPHVATDAERAELRGAGIILAGSGMALLRAGVGFLTFFLAFALKRHGEPAWVYGIVIAGSAIGGFLGALLAPPAARRTREEAVLVTALLAPALAALLAARSFDRLWLVVSALVLGFGAAAGRLAFDSLVQRDAPDADRSTAFARFEARFQLAWVVGGLLPVVVPLPGRLGYLILAGALGFAGVTYVGGMRAAGVWRPGAGRSP
jgi:MFS family permease